MLVQYNSMQETEAEKIFTHSINAQIYLLLSLIWYVVTNLWAHSIISTLWSSVAGLFNSQSLWLADQSSASAGYRMLYSPFSSDILINDTVTLKRYTPFYMFSAWRSAYVLLFRIIILYFNCTEVKNFLLRILETRGQSHWYYVN